MKNCCQVITEVAFHKMTFTLMQVIFLMPTFTFTRINYYYSSTTFTEVRMFCTLSNIDYTLASRANPTMH